MSRAYEIGVQSVVFKTLSVEELLSELETTGIRRLEVGTNHLPPDASDAEITAVERAIEDSPVSVCGYGVVDLTDPGDAEPAFRLADRLGAGYVNVNYPPDRDDITAELCELAESFDLDACIHNYSTVHHDDLSLVFSTIDDVVRVLDDFPHPRLGCCLDTGHFLVQSITPEAAIPELGDRIESVHLKDTSDVEIEDAPGTGQLDLGRVIDLLDTHADVDAPLVVEYELPAERATEALQEAEERILAVLDQ